MDILKDKLITSVAIENLKILNERYNKSLSLIGDNNKLSLIEKDNFDPLCKLESLEYPIYFTYHHLLDIISNNKDISYQVKKYLLEQIDKSFDNIVEYIDDYDDIDDDNNTINQILIGIYEKYDLIEENTIYHPNIERFIYFFDDLVEVFKTSNKYLYFSTFSPLINIKPGVFLEDEGECDSYSNDEFEEDSDGESNEDLDESSNEESNEESNKKLD